MSPTLHFAPVDFDDFHQVELPARITAGHGALAARDVAGVEPIAFQLAAGPAYTYRPAGDTVTIAAGVTSARTVVELSPDAWSDYVNELRTCFGLLYANLVSFPEGGFDDLARWEPALRALFHGLLPRPKVLRNASPRDRQIARVLLVLSRIYHLSQKRNLTLYAMMSRFNRIDRCEPVPEQMPAIAGVMLAEPLLTNFAISDMPAI